MKKRIVIFASGSGTNTQNLIQYFQQGEIAEVVLVLSNKKDAKVLSKAKNLNVKSLHFEKAELNSETGVLQLLKNTQPDLIVLAGFLLKFPDCILKAFPNKVINIHPALLPKYGGKGMYGSYVHEAVVANKDNETGITIHYVNENYDEGAIIFQKSVKLSEKDTAIDVAKKVHELEYNFFPKVIEGILNKNSRMDSDIREK
ncbi:formyltetrahydrofolate-dependent phosphoribosylglycinamide formyltransferase [Ulvibacter sp. MAR_2010_11]|uniref:phosphoribosylglycinamide formyltransferase n=1 Tax=Ulvibacter sp. MAR_2010_11 TaxID=1250229 RepID=UPI000C2C50DE|nr:phosphoribosylglycinamide formyltransferase [Ulvibacter sp. MAR_2010_11]PKA83009.1 formyltetrahydrofolate-dependent phosphoribosylglycinamide formyltransferase [Ulvibacter sp. MAR_2010_11]